MKPSSRSSKPGVSKRPQKQGPSYTTRPTLQINLAAIKSNYQALQKKVGQAKVAASVKADAYGLGAERVGRALYGAGCRNFFVATAGEGKALREYIGDNASIYVLNGPAPRDLTLFFGSRLKPVLNSLVQARLWADTIKDVRSAPFSAIHVDTGMNRLGFSEEEFEIFSKNKALREGVNYELIMSHLACAPDKSHAMNKSQLAQFKRQSARLPVGPMSLCNSAGIYLGKPYHFQMVRPGISLYSNQATLDAKDEVTQSVLTLMAPVLQLRSVKKGQTVGYNAAFTVERDMLIATVGAGYADGIPVSSSGFDTVKGYATLQSKRVPIVGRVSMDLTMLDVTDLKKKPRIGDWAAFRGENLETDAMSSGTISYELLVRLSQRARRQYM